MPSFTGVRSPPLRGEGHPRQDGLAVEGSGMARKAVFSEGRGLYVRIARPKGCQGISLMGRGDTRSHLPNAEIAP